MEEDRYTRITLRIPKELHAALTVEADATSKSLNAEIIARLQASFDPAQGLPSVVRSEVDSEAERLGISPQEALARLVVDGSQSGAPMVLYVRADAGMTIEQYRALFVAAKEITPPDARVFKEQG